MEINNNLNGITNSNSNDTVSLRELLFKYLQRWYWFVLAVILALIIATLYIKRTNIKYQVKTTILLRNDNNTNPEASQMAMMESLGFNGVSKEVEDEIQVMSSKKIIKQAIDTLGLQTEYFQKNGLKYIEKYKNIPFRLNTNRQLYDSLKQSLTFYVKANSGKYNVELYKSDDFVGNYLLKNIQQPFATPVGKFNFNATSLPKDGNKYKIIVYPINNLVENYSGRLNVSTVNKQSNAIQLSLVETNINKAEDFLNKIVTLYNLDAIIDKNIIATNTKNFILEQLGIISKDLFDVEDQVETYKRANNLTDLSSEASLYLQSASDYEKKLTDIQTQINMVKSVESFIKNTKNQNSLIPANVVSSDPTLANSIQQYNTAVLTRMRLAQTAGDKNPALIQINTQIEALRSNVITSVNSVKTGLEIANNDIKNKDSQYSSKIKNVPTQERRFLEIKRQQEITQNLYLFLSQKKLENELALASTAPAARTIDRAYALLDPVAPKRMMIYLVALILGLLIPFLIIYFRDLINNKVEDSKEFQKLVKAPFLGSIATSRESERVVVKEGVTTPIVEMFRLIRTNLKFMMGGGKSSVILVTSTVSGEGKTFTSINLSMSFALLKKKTVLVGLDIRNPTLADYLHIPKEKGVTLYLSDNSYTVDDVIERSGFHSYLDVIPAGPIPPNPSELLINPRLEELIKELKNRYDYIVVDTAPIGIVSDTYLLNRVADNCVYVSRQNYTPKDAANLINDIYHEHKLNNMGVVLNGTPFSSGYGYSYGYGKKYKSSKPPKLSFGEKMDDYFSRLFIKRK